MAKIENAAANFAAKSRRPDQFERELPIVGDWRKNEHPQFERFRSIVVVQIMNAIRGGIFRNRLADESVQDFGARVSIFLAEPVNVGIPESMP